MKMSDYTKGREDGLALALSIVREGGLEALEAEIKLRNIVGVYSPLAKKDLEKAAEPIRVHTAAIMMAMSLHVLRDEFDFGRSRLERFKDRYNLKIDCLVDDMLTWYDIILNIQKETGITIIVPHLEEDDK